MTAAKKGTAEDFFFRVFRNLFAVPDTVLLHRRFTLRNAVRAPGFRQRRGERFSRKPRRKGRTRLRQFEHPAGSVQKRSRPLGANTLTQQKKRSRPASTRSAGAEKKVPPVRVEPACGSSCAPVSRCRKAPDSTRDKNFQENMRYPLAKYAKIGYYIQALFCMNSRMMFNDVKNTIIWRHSDYDRR